MQDYSKKLVEWTQLQFSTSSPVFVDTIFAVVE